MFFDSIQFKAMESGLAALNMKQEVITHNIANLDTPDYKAYEVSFGNTLERAYEEAQRKDADEKTKDDKIDYDFKATVTRTGDISVLVDGNNVDIDEQSLELYSAYLQSAAIIQKMNSKISDIRYVLTQSNFK